MMGSNGLWATLRTLGRRIRLDQAGATAVEYGLMVALIAAVIIASAAALGTKTDQCFDTVKAAMDAGGGATTTNCTP